VLHEVVAPVVATWYILCFKQCNVIVTIFLFRPADEIGQFLVEQMNKLHLGLQFSDNATKFTIEPEPTTETVQGIKLEEGEDGQQLVHEDDPLDTLLLEYVLLFYCH
jgi:hypothetical protein